MPSYAFLVTLADEGVVQLEACLGFLRSAYPDAPVVVICDGAPVSGYRVVCRRHGATYHEGAFFKRIEAGGRWWRRFLELGIATGADWLVKLDPDARINRPFNGTPPSPISGTIENVGKSTENIQGGCQVIAREAASKILDSPLLDSRALSNEWTYVNNDDAMRRWVRSQAYLSTDASLMWLARNLGVAYGKWSEIGSQWKSPAPVGDYAVTHPHKLESESAPRDTPLHVITTCKGRLEHLKQTLPTWVEEPDVSVLVVDYGCPDGTSEWVRENHPSVDTLLVKDVPKFHLSRARNLGAAHSPPGWWCFWDADLLCHPGWSKAIRRHLRSRRYLLASPIAWNQFGSAVVRSEDFRSIGGYDELMRGWGAEDGDFYSRLRHIGIRPGSFPGRFISSIPHSDEDRTRHYETKKKSESQRLNNEYLRLKSEFIAGTGRLPTEDERVGFLEEAYRETDLPVPGWLYDPSSESPPVVEMIPGAKLAVALPPKGNAPIPAPKDDLPPMADDSSESFAGAAQESVTIKRTRDFATGAPIINVNVTIQNIGAENAQQTPNTETKILSD